MLPKGVLDDGDVKYCKDTVVSSNCGIIPPTRVVCKYGGLCRAVWPCLPPAQPHRRPGWASDHHHHRDRDHHHRRHHHHHYLQNLNFRSQSLTSWLPIPRVEICHDRSDWQSCKICASCVNFSRKQPFFLRHLRRSSGFTLTKCDFKLNLLKFYTLDLILTKKYLNCRYCCIFAVSLGEI